MTCGTEIGLGGFGLWTLSDLFVLLVRLVSFVLSVLSFSFLLSSQGAQIVT